MGIYDSKPNKLEDIKRMSLSELNAEAAHLRRYLIDAVAKNGGHLASNLGAVELTLALHKVFDSPKDKIIWDVGHQTYVHKLLTGRYEAMQQIRQLDGLSGFPKRKESEHDMYDSGHSGTSISAALGYATARDLKNEHYSCVAVIGDGALTGGVAWEAMNSAGSDKTQIIVILNDNQMSISGNVGGIPKHLTRLRTSRAYNVFKRELKNKSHDGSLRFFRRVRDAIKYLFVSRTVFEEMGFKYYGPIDGHDIEQLTDAFSFAKTLENQPVLLHVITKKGKGFGPAEENPAKYHGIGVFNPETADDVISFNPDSWSEIFGSELTKLAYDDERIVAVTAAMADGTGLSAFGKAHPDRLFDVGIAEQHAVSFAAGLALNGLRPVVALYSTFMQRAYDQILSEVCLQNLPIVFGVDRAGVTGSDGETHQGEFDIAYLSAMPNMTLLSPRDESSLRAMLRFAFTLDSPAAIRYPKGTAPEKGLFPDTENFSPVPQIIRIGKELLLISDGNMLCTALAAAEILDKNNINAAVCDLRILSPLPGEHIENMLDEYKCIVTIEDACLAGGIGERIAVMAAVKKNAPPVLNIAWPDKFIEQGSVEQLRERYGLDAVSVAERTLKFFEETTGCNFN